MTNKESLSALVDGEASEIEIHRLVREFKSDDTLVPSWIVYQQIRSVVRAERSSLGSRKQRQLFGRISQAIQIEDQYHAKVERGSTSRFILTSSLAVAACLAVAVFLGIQTFEMEEELSIVENMTEPPEVLEGANDAQTSELIELDEEKQRRLKTYLNQHDRMSRMNNYQQLVNYKEGSGK